MLAKGGIPSRSLRLGRAFYELLEHGSQLDFSLSRAGLAALEFNPALVEAVEHLNAGHGVLHALRFEQRLPSLAWHRFRADRTAQQVGEGGRDLLRSHTTRRFQLDYAAADPRGLDKFGRHTPDVRCGNHWHCLVEGLQEALDQAVLHRRSDVPARVLHEPSWA